MSVQYLRYSFEEELTPREAARKATAAGGVLVRVDRRDGRTHMIVATSGGAVKVEGHKGEPVEVAEKDLLDLSESR